MFDDEGPKDTARETAETSKPASKKPIFKKKPADRAGIEQEGTADQAEDSAKGEKKSELGMARGKSVLRDIKGGNGEDMDVDEDNEFKPARSTSKRNVRRSVADRMKKVKRVSEENGKDTAEEVEINEDKDDIKQEPSSVKSVLKEKTAEKVNEAKGNENIETDHEHDESNTNVGAVGLDGGSDEEFLNTRRRGGRKRKSTSRYLDWAKKAKKGVEYTEDNGTKENKENQVTYFL